MPRIRKNNINIQDYKINLNEDNDAIELIREI